MQVEELYGRIEAQQQERSGNRQAPWSMHSNGDLVHETATSSSLFGGEM